MCLAWWWGLSCLWCWGGWCGLCGCFVFVVVCFVGGLCVDVKDVWLVRVLVGLVVAVAVEFEGMGWGLG
ncbi:hypothetical protein, partial [Pseudomonas syringae group genomosp. 7]|uniref:hypothetical protein n=1 Tax=Pseudomonas syringae group genomosp. 7 TaxID=251699 RepID=UPI00376F6D43